jgi:hypothetical protein
VQCCIARRHVRYEAPSCPFRGGRFGLHATLAGVVLTVGVASCGPERGLEDSGAAQTDASSTTRTDSADPVTSTNPGSTNPGSTVTGTDPDSTGATDTDGPHTTSAGFIDRVDVLLYECDAWLQDCPDGMKCAPFDNTGQGVWNALQCVPVDPDPAQPGGPCHAQGSGTSGIDDCDHGSICWNVDPDTLEGTCVAQCQGTVVDPSCPDGSACAIANAGVLTLCLQTCTPALEDCPPGETCHPIGEVVVCVPEGSGMQGGYGEHVGLCFASD